MSSVCKLTSSFRDRHLQMPSRDRQPPIAHPLLSSFYKTYCYIRPGRDQTLIVECCCSSSMASKNPKNLYHRRLVAEGSSKACWVCYRPSSTVLITPDQDDWFHVCPGHLKDRKFAIPQDEEDLAEKKRQEELEQEVIKVKAEFEEKMRKKLARRKQKEHEKEGTKEENKDEAKDEKELEQQKEDKLKEIEKKKEAPKPTVEGPRIFVLDKSFWQMRMQKKRDAENAKRQRERLKAPGAFPTVPTGDFSKPG